MGDPTSVQGGGMAPRRRRPSSPGSSVLTPPTGVPAVPELDGLAPAQRSVERQGPSTPRPVVAQPCLCGHARDAHEHHRRGHDCGACGAAGCETFRPVGGASRRLLRRLGLVD